MKTNRLDKWLQEMIKCTQCGYCKEVCPVFDDVGWDSSVARGKVALAYGLYLNEIEPDDSVIERLYQCTTCMDCTRRCPSSTKVVDIIESARKDLIEAGYARDIHNKISNSIKKFGNPYGEEERRTKILGEEPHKAKIAYFAGCTTTFRNPEIAKSAISIFKKLGADYTLLNEVCCGSVIQRIGFPDDDLIPLIDANLKAIEETGAEKALISCAGCLRMFREEYPKFRDFDFEPLHFTEWLMNQDLKLKPMNKIVTYHDPCHIGRHIGIYDAPRKVIEKIPGVTFKEMEFKGQTSRCCGGGGGVRSGFPELSKDIAGKRVAQAEFADILLNTCPFCLNNLERGKEAIGSNTEIRDLVEIIDELLE